MTDDEKMLKIGLWMFFVVLIMTMVLQVCYRTQYRQINLVRKQIVQTQQDIAAAEAQFASFVRPEILRNMVMSVTPKAEVVSFNKSVAIENIEKVSLKSDRSCFMTDYSVGEVMKVRILSNPFELEKFRQNRQSKELERKA